VGQGGGSRARPKADSLRLLPSGPDRVGERSARPDFHPPYGREDTGWQGIRRVKGAAPTLLSFGARYDTRPELGQKFSDLCERFTIGFSSIILAKDRRILAQMIDDTGFEATDIKAARCEFCLVKR
jgi:hypothetical protein